jgi:uncharacterized protein YukE
MGLDTSGAGGGGTHLKVSSEQVLANAQFLEDLCTQANQVLSNYLNHTHDVHAVGMWTGPAAGANLNTAEEIAAAQSKLTTHWSEVINTLRRASATLDNAEQQAAHSVGSVGTNL